MTRRKYKHQLPPGATVCGALDYGPSTHSFRDTVKAKHIADPGATARAAALLKTRAQARGWIESLGSVELEVCAGLLRPPPQQHMDMHSAYQERRAFGTALQSTIPHMHGLHNENQHQLATCRLAEGRSALHTSSRQLKQQATRILAHSKAKETFIRAYDHARRSGTAPPAVPVQLKGQQHKDAQRTRPTYVHGSTRHTMFGTYCPRATQRACKQPVHPVRGGDFDLTTKRDLWWKKDTGTAQARRLARIRRDAALHTAHHEAAPVEVTFCTNLSTE